MQGASINDSNTSSYGSILNYNNAGNYEFCKITSVTPFSISLENPLLRSYTASGKVQIIKVPQYKSPVVTQTLTCPAWDGTTGGVLVLNAEDTVFLHANINVSGKGFRGGIHHKGDHVMSIRFDYTAKSPDPTWYALKGEGIAFNGVSPYTSARGAPANAGGGGNIHTTGGGGGANFGCGGNGGWGYAFDTTAREKTVFGIGGYSLTYSNAENKFFMGGGGGAGHEHFNNGTSGANGGGIIIIICNTLEANGYNIYAMGNNSASSGAFGDGTGGAGAGGTVLLSANHINTLLSVDVKGGGGGSSIFKGFGPGGGGGGGLIGFDAATTPTGITDLFYNGGSGGLAGGGFYGATNGCAGGMLYDISFPFNTSFPFPKAAFQTTSADSLTLLFTNNSEHATHYHWDFGDEKTDSAANPTHTFSSPGIYPVTLVAYNALGCTDTLRKEVFPMHPVNIFTPNGDGNNETFSFVNLFTDDYKAEWTVFNRWGVSVFQGDNEHQAWSGNDAPSGTYFYILTILNNKTQNSIVYKGVITLIR